MYIFGPDRSPDGRTIVFSAGVSPPDVYAVETGMVRRITRCRPPCEGGNTVASWSPDATRIAFVRGWGGHGSIRVMDADGNGQRKLAECAEPACEGQDSGPVWSPGGRYILFERGPEWEGDLFVVSVDDPERIQQITDIPMMECCASWTS